jgi:predicted glycosyltransferase
VRRGKRILVYAQHLSGVGHHVRIREIARALAREHQVAFVQGGSPVPRPDDGSAFQRIELPAIRRGAQGIEPLDRGRELQPVLRERAAILRRAAAEFAPDVVVVEHYPFSKWELESEIDALIDAARAANPDLERVCSVRDILRKTRYECLADDEYQRRVVARLNDRFDTLLVHADPSFTRLEEHFAGAGELALRVDYTGFVSEKPGPASGAARARPDGPGTGEGRVVVSTGGGKGSAALVERVLEAWALLVARGADAGRNLHVFSGLFWSEGELARLSQRAAGGRCVLLPFTVDFLSQVEQADLSISRAGYNTCTNLLETRTRALLLPDPRMSDQRFRAQRFAEQGLAEVVYAEAPSPGLLADAIETALRREPPKHALDLDGAQRTCALLSR